MEIWLASGNAGKIREYKALLTGLPLELHSQSELSFYTSPEETADDFVGNARIKAQSLAAVKPGAWIFAEDSGLVVDGLDGKPGIYSARYAGDNASDAENRAKVLKMLKIRNASNRKAKFVASVVLLDPQGNEQSFYGELCGQIIDGERGQGGFGYDPIFQADGFEQTTAEISAAEKNRISHRGIAARALLEFLQGAV